MYKKISSMLDKVANSLETKGLIAEAYEIDKLADQIDTIEKNSNKQQALLLVQNATQEEIQNAIESLKKGQQENKVASEIEASVPLKNLMVALSLLFPVATATAAGTDELILEKKNNAPITSQTVEKIENEAKQELSREIAQEAKKIEQEIEDMDYGRMIISRPQEVAGKSATPINEGQAKILRKIVIFENRAKALNPTKAQSLASSLLTKARIPTK